MTKIWFREDTKYWINQLEHRIEDIDYYLTETVKWCETNDIDDDQQVFACMMMAVVWVSNMRNEPISKREAYEILGIEDWHKAPDEPFELGEKYQGWDLEPLLWAVLDKF